jgi:hypothetical protein
VCIYISKYKHNTFILSELTSTSTHTQHQQQHNQRRGKCKRGLDGAAASWLRGVFNIARARQCQHRIHTESELHTALTERGAHYVCTLLKSHSFFMCAARTKGITDPLAGRLHLCTHTPLSAETRKLIEKMKHRRRTTHNTTPGAENGRRKHSQPLSSADSCRVTSRKRFTTPMMREEDNRPASRLVYAICLSGPIVAHQCQRSLL